MSLSRLALRLAAVEALCPHATVSGPYPTWAGPNVEDSRINPIADADGWKKIKAQTQGRPLISVYTEEQETTPIAEGVSYPAEVEIADLVIEIIILAGATVEVARTDGKPMTAGAPESRISTAEIEAMLDMIEQQVRNVLDPNVEQPADPIAATARAIYLKVARELHHVKSAPVRDAINRDSRVVTRTVTFRLRIPHPQAYSAPKAGVPSDIAGLPEPLLGVARALAATSPGGQLVRTIARGQPAPAVLNPLRDIIIASTLNRGVAPTAARNEPFDPAHGEGRDLTSDVKL